MSAPLRFSHNNNYATPDYLYQALHMEFDFDLDPCPLNPEFDAAFYQDGLKLDWDGHRVFCNPPWSDIGPWVEKAYSSRCLAVFLVPARTDTGWFAQLLHRKAELRFFRKRVHFVREGVSCNPTDGTLVAIVKNFQ